MYCSKCGASVPEGAVFCSACGQPVPTTSAVPPVPPAYTPPSAVPPPTQYPPAYAPPAQAAWQTSARPPVAYAGFWLRFVAWIIDRVVLWFAGSIVTLPFAAGIGIHQLLRNYSGSSPQDFFMLFATFRRLFFIMFLLEWLYYALLESSAWQATLGKKALGLEVADLVGRRITFGRASGRYFARYISIFTLGIGYIMAGFTEKKQALHDMIAGTLVIRKL